MDPKLQRRVQRYGWDLASADYEPLWRTQLAPAHAALLRLAALKAGDSVLDVACGTGLVTFAAARAVAPGGRVLGVDISGDMVAAAEIRAPVRGGAPVAFQRMDAEALDLPHASFDVALCALGLMYLPDPETAVTELRRVLKPGGRLALAIWGRRSLCAWSASFPIAQAEVASEVCPLFFRLGEGDSLEQVCAGAGFEQIQVERIRLPVTHANSQEACDAAFAGGPLALAWSRFDAVTRARVRRLYIEAIAPWRRGDGYALPAEFVVLSARSPE